MRKRPHREGESLMKNRQHTLLAGVAALALFATSGMALAQQGQQDQKGSGSAAQSSMSQRSEQGAKNQGAKNQATNQGLKQQGAQQGKNESAMSRQSSGQNARNESKMQSKQGTAENMSAKGKGEKSFNRSAQELKQNKGANTTNRTAQTRQNRFNEQSKTTQSKTGQFANQRTNRTQPGTSTAQRNEQLKGLQGSTRAPMQGATSTERSSGAANVSLNEQQRSQIRSTIINSRSAPRVSSVDFSVNVGTVVPRGHIHLVRVPETLVRIEPTWRGYLYFVFNDELVIVDPRTMRIIDVLPV
jgi:Protein of unknown function (DUF1236)